MKLLLDENLSRRMVPLIASHYPGSSQVALLGLERVSDTAIWAYARQHDFIIVTKDSDFVDLSTLYGQPPKIILLKTGNQTWQMTAQALIDRRELLPARLDPTPAPAPAPTPTLTPTRPEPPPARAATPTPTRAPAAPADEGSP